MPDATMPQDIATLLTEIRLLDVSGDATITYAARRLIINARGALVMRGGMRI